MQYILLTKNERAIVDDDDFTLLNIYKWQINGGGYAQRRLLKGENKMSVLMHRQVLGLGKSDKVQVDHINGNKLDNRKVNLRVCTNRQNQQNTFLVKSAVGLKGVTEKKWTSGQVRYCARITLNGKIKHLGYFKNRFEAAMCYDEFAVKYFGEFAKTNKQLGLL